MPDRLEQVKWGGSEIGIGTVQGYDQKLENTVQLSIKQNSGALVQFPPKTTTDDNGRIVQNKGVDFSLGEVMIRCYVKFTDVNCGFLFTSESTERDPWNDANLQYCFGFMLEKEGNLVLVKKVGGEFEKEVIGQGILTDTWYQCQMTFRPKTEQLVQIKPSLDWGIDKWVTEPIAELKLEEYIDPSISANQIKGQPNWGGQPWLITSSMASIQSKPASDQQILVYPAKLAVQPKLVVNQINLTNQIKPINQINLTNQKISIGQVKLSGQPALVYSSDLVDKPLQLNQPSNVFNNKQIKGDIIDKIVSYEYEFRLDRQAVRLVNGRLRKFMINVLTRKGDLDYLINMRQDTIFISFEAHSEPIPVLIPPIIIPINGAPPKGKFAMKASDNQATGQATGDDWFIRSHCVNGTMEALTAAGGRAVLTRGTVFVNNVANRTKYTKLTLVPNEPVRVTDFYFSFEGIDGNSNLRNPRWEEYPTGNNSYDFYGGYLLGEVDRNACVRFVNGSCRASNPAYFDSQIENQLYINLDSNKGTVNVRGTSRLQDGAISVRINAKPKGNYDVRWSGAQNAIGNEIEIKIDRTKIVNVNFTPRGNGPSSANLYSLNLTASSGGSVAVSNTIIGDDVTEVTTEGDIGTDRWKFDKGTDVEITAKADTGYRFTGWSGTTQSGETITVKMDADKDIIANFTAIMDNKDVNGAPFAGKYALGQNYPNPFNPETWIPFQLKDSDNVKIFIYSQSGELVRELDLGYKPAGVYYSPDRAGHWDGKDRYGIPVASGVYFYKINAGKFSAVKKLLIQK